MHKLAAFWLCLIVAGAQVGALAADERPLREIIDARIQAGWQTNGVTPAEAADDAAFLRRVSLDLTGAIPSISPARFPRRMRPPRFSTTPPPTNARR